MIKVLELFSGTGSVGKCCKKLDWDVVSVDLLLPADHEVDILEFDYKQYPKNEFDIVWASPPCVYYSNLQNCWLGRKKKDGIVVTRDILEQRRRESDKLIEKTLEIIDYFQPELWFMENPATGCLKKRDVVKGLNFYDVSYCMYSDWGYEKKTRIWTNKKDWDNLICDRSGKCGNMIEIPTDGAVRHDTGKPLKCKTRKLHNNLLCKSETLRAIRKHEKGFGSYTEGQETIKPIYMSKKHKLNVSKDVHTVGEKKGKHKKDVSIDYGSGTNRLDRYRVPEDLIFSLFLD